MSALQLGLVILGVILVVAVLLYNHLQERRYRRILKQAIPEAGVDPLMGQQAPSHDMPREPSLEPSAEPHAVVTPAPAPSSPFSLPPLSLSEAPNPVLEFEVALRGLHPVSAGQLWQTLSETTLLSRNVRWAALEEGTGHRFTVSGPSEHRFTTYAAALKLGSRTQPVSEARVALFLDEMRGLGQRLQMELQPVDMAVAIRASQALDRFLSQADVLIGINVIFAEGSWPTAHQVRQAVEVLGLVLDREVGLFNAPEGNFTLIQQDSAPFLDVEHDPAPVAGVTWLLDVPRTKNGFQALRDMYSGAEKLASALGGRVVDDNGAAFGARQLGAVEKHLTAIIQQMDKQGIPAGSPQALNLFAS